ncbi:MAG: methyltransferase domain-containing protein [Chloroflexi bacterium]|nr:methyltransferase domain-containing protein [Chloroflexota bacterium]
MPDKSLGYVDQKYLKAAADLLHQFKERTYERMQIQSGASLLDVGCGAGADTIPLAGRVGAAGQVIGVDHDREMVTRARSAAEAANVNKRVIHICADASRLPLASNSFDASRSERLFQHLPRPELALNEMVRVTKPGGRVVVLDTDHGTWSVDTPERDIERRITRFKADHFGHNGYAGRQLYGLFRRAGLQDVTCEIVSGYFTDYELVRFMFMLDEVEPAAVKAGVISEDELTRWRASLESETRSGTFFCSESMVLAAGVK